MDIFIEKIKHKTLQFKPKYTNIDLLTGDKGDKYISLFDELNKDFREVDWYFQSKYLFL